MATNKAAKINKT